MSPSTAKSPIVDVKNMAQFKLAVEANRMSVIHFWADWATQCGPMDEAMRILADGQDLANVAFLRVEAEAEPEISMAWEVAAVPTFLFFGPGGKLLDRVEGAKAADVTKKVKELASKVDLQLKLCSAPATGGSNVSSPSPPKKDLNTKLKELVSASPCMLFMKGTPGAPECGFSKQIIEILNGLNADYGSFDILRDDEVRQGLKTYSNWPTYPQLYIKGELVGGLDIVKELLASGELSGMLPKKKASLTERLRALTHQATVMVFMKGNRKEPKCGFSRQLMEILEETGVAFQTFDILHDEEVRQGLKEFSKWPTYPQVYVKGNLVGGLDIIKEIKEAGELVATLNGSQ